MKPQRRKHSMRDKIMHLFALRFDDGAWRGEIKGSEIPGVAATVRWSLSHCPEFVCPGGPGRGEKAYRLRHNALVCIERALWRYGFLTAPELADLLGEAGFWTDETLAMRLDSTKRRLATLIGEGRVVDRKRETHLTLYTVRRWKSDLELYDG